MGFFSFILYLCTLCVKIWNGIKSHINCRLPIAQSVTRWNNLLCNTTRHHPPCVRNNKPFILWQVVLCLKASQTIVPVVSIKLDFTDIVLLPFVSKNKRMKINLNLYICLVKMYLCKCCVVYFRHCLNILRFFKNQVLIRKLVLYMFLRSTYHNRWQLIKITFYSL